jgi:hypothetical protein
MKKLFTICLLLVFSHFTFAQDIEALADSASLAAKDTTYWISDFSVGLNFNQAAFSGNWKAGG